VSERMRSRISARPAQLREPKYAKNRGLSVSGDTERSEAGTRDTDRTGSSRQCG